MIREFENWLKNNITQNSNSSIAYETCKQYINGLNSTPNEYQEMIKIAVEWIDF